jgi:DUF917 family protein
MKKVTANVFAIQIKVIRNTADKSKNQWAQIVDVMTGKTLHTGQLSHIRRVARKRYNVKVQL